MELSRNGTGRKLAATMVTLIATAFAVVGWLQLAPPSLGGQTSYAVITGNSMEPMLHGGDLAVIRRADSYEKGDVLAYNSSQIHNLVLHRIIGIENDRFVTKGDHNDFVDAEKPGPDQLVGQLWFSIPRVGSALAKLRDPRIAAPFAAVVGLVALGAFTGGRRRDRRRSAGSAGREKADVETSSWKSGRAVALVSAIVILIVSGAAGAVAFTRPTHTALTKTVGYQQQGRFSYTATVDRGSVYDSTTVGTGEPVYLRVAKDLNVAYNYQFEAESAIDVQGSGAMTTTLAASNGWSRTIATSEPSDIQNGELHLEQQLNVDELQQLVEQVQKETGVSETYYTLAFAADVEARGDIAGRNIEESFSGSMPFQLDSFQLRLDTGSESGLTQDPTMTMHAGRVAVDQKTQGRLDVGSLSIDVPTLRVVSIAGSALGLLVLALALTLGRRRTDELQRIESRNGDLIVRVRSADHVRWDSAIEVQDFDALKKLSDAYETMVLHDTDSNDLFFTICEAQVYFCRIARKRSEKRMGTADNVELPLRGTVVFIEDLVGAGE